MTVKRDVRSNDMRMLCVLKFNVDHDHILSANVLLHQIKPRGDQNYLRLKITDYLTLKT